MTPPDKIETPRTDAVERNFGEMPGAMRRMERELTQWREVAGRLAEELRDERRGEYGFIGEPTHGLLTYAALAKSLSDVGKG